MQGFDPSNMGQFYNPYEQQVVDQTMQDVRKGLAQQNIARRAGAIGAGAFGGSRSRLLGEEMAESAGRGAAQQIGALRAGGFQNAMSNAQAAFEAQQQRQAAQAGLLGQLGAQQSDIGARLGQLGAAQQAGQLNQAGALGSVGAAQSGLGQQMAGLGGLAQQQQGTDISRMQSMGAMQRDQNQRRLDLDYGNFVGQYNQPLQTIGGIGQLASGMSPALGGTTLRQSQEGGGSPNALMQGVGTGLAAWGALRP